MSDLFPRATGLSKGYEEQAVADFFTTARQAYEGGGESESFGADEIRTAVFPLVRGGFDVRTVDGALGRLESAFIHRDRANYIATHGEPAWFEKIADEATSLYPRLLRPHGDRFRHPENGGRGYSCVQVDALLDRMAAFFDDQGQLSESDVRFALFSSAKGENAYEEAQVDFYLGKAVRILMAVS